MKKFALLPGLLLAFISFNRSLSDESFLRFVIDNDMTEKQIAALVESANTRNIKLDVHVESYDKRGRIKEIRGNVEFGETGSGTFYSDNLGKIVIKQDMNAVNGGFSIIVRKKLI